MCIYITECCSIAYTPSTHTCTSLPYTCLTVCSSMIMVAAISSVLRSVLSQSEGITKLVVFGDTVVRFLTSAIHTFKIGWVTFLCLAYVIVLCNVQLNMQAVFSTMLSFKVYVRTVDSLLHVDLNVALWVIGYFLDPVRFGPDCSV